MVQHCFREQNGVADVMAKEGASLKFLKCTVVFVVPPMCATKLFGKTSQGLSLVGKSKFVMPLMPTLLQAAMLLNLIDVFCL